MKKGKIIIISGPSGSGKTTLYKKLLARQKKLEKSISVTTRPPRPGEVPGKDYIFVSMKMFLYKVRAGHFLEYEKFFDNYYGTPHKNVRDMINAGRNVLMCIDVKGAKTVAKKYPQAVRIFIKTPSIRDLEDRLKKRGSEDKDTIDSRLQRAAMELDEAKNYNHVIVNDNLSRAQAQLNKIILQEVG